MTAEPDPRLVLELRIHGVNNTTPASVLDRPECQIEQIDGDKLGSFWQVLPDRLADRGRGDNGYVPSVVHREAYSWGGMARNSPGVSGTGVSSIVANAAGRIGWALLLPFGLANVAYWSRALPESGASPSRWWAGRGAAGIRVFGLGLTILLVSTVCEVALDLLAVQCYPDPAPDKERVQRCLPVLPTWLDPLADTGVATRLAYASLVPVLVLLALWFLSARSRLRYEEVTDTGARSDGGTRMLARDGLWRGGAMVRGLTQLHVAAGLSVIVIASAWPALFGTGAACQRLTDVASDACRQQVTGAPGWWRFGAVLLAAFAVLVGAIVLACLRVRDAPDVPGRSRGAAVVATWVVLVAAVASLAVELWFLLWLHPGIIQADQGRPLPLPGVNAVPLIVVAVLVGIAASALAWRANRLAPGILGVIVTAGLLSTHFWPVLGIFWRVLRTVAVVGGFILLLALAHCVKESTRHATAWGGTAPGVLLGLSLLVALTLSTLLVVGAGGWLNGSSPASELVSCPGTSPATDTPPLCAAPSYIWFGGGTVVTLGLVVVLAIFMVVRLAVWNMRAKKPSSASGSPDSVGPQVVRARNAAALAHQAERVTGALGALGLGMAAIAVGGPAVPLEWWPTTGWYVETAHYLADISAGLTAAAATAIILGFSGAGLLSGSRPLGLVWDLLCFLPRAAHPFSPPCYAERAVPEITGRVRRWLAVGERSVVLSAHSLGAVLAVAVVFVLGKDHRQRVYLITYGVQLRSYFGRIFPDLLGLRCWGRHRAGPRRYAVSTRGVWRSTMRTPTPARCCIRRQRTRLQTTRCNHGSRVAGSASGDAQTTSGSPPSATSRKIRSTNPPRRSIPRTPARCKPTATTHERTPTRSS